jgi:hypothetical protein
MIVVAHDRIGTQVHGEGGTKQFDAIDDPLTPVFEVKASSCVLATQKGASYTP